MLFASLFMTLSFASGFDNIESSTSICYLNKGSNRLGDTLIRYATDKWSAFHLNIPLIYDRFEYSDQLMFSEVEYPAEEFHMPKNGRWVAFPFYSLPTQQYILEPGCFVYGALEGGYLTPSMIKEMKKDGDFMEVIRHVIAPKEELDLICPPMNTISVAVHVRRGPIFDGRLSSRQIIDPRFRHLDPNRTHRVPLYLGFDYSHPLKCPPEQYFIDQIRYIAELLEYPPMYVYIFTDDPNPLAIMKRVQTVVDLPNVVYDCRTHENRHNNNVLIDLFSMSRFDCLIHPGQSAYSLIAHLIGDHRIVIYPTKYSWSNDYLKMENIQVEVKDFGVLVNLN